MKIDIQAAVIGAKGFIGSNLVSYLKEVNISLVEIGRHTPVADISGYLIDTVFFCAGNSKTFLSKKDPVKCLEENIITLFAFLTNLRYRKFVYLSSISVYPQTGTNQEEDSKIDISDLPIYGSHKYLGERYVKEFANSWLIVRPTGFFGEGLKKNLIFDLRNEKIDIYVSRSSYIDYMPVKWFCDTLYTLSMKAEEEIINVGSGHPVSVNRLIEMKPRKYTFHEERIQDDRHICFERLRKYVPQLFRPDDLEKMIEEFINNR